MAATLKFLYNLKTEAASQLTVDQLISIIINGSGTLLGLYDPTKTYKKGDHVAYIDSDGLLHTLICTANSATGDPITLADWAEYSILDELEGIKNNYMVVTTTQPTSRFNKVWMQQSSKDSNGIVHGIYSYNNTLGNSTNSYIKVYPKNSIEDVGISTFTAVTNLDAIPTLNYNSDSLKNLVQNLDANIRKLARDKYDASNVSSTATANKVLTLDANAQLPATANKAVYDTNGVALTTYIKGLTVSGQDITYTYGNNTTGVLTTQDTKVTNTLSTGTKAYVTATTSAISNTGTQVFDTGVYLGTEAGSLYASNFYGGVHGNADTASSADKLTTARTLTLSGVTAVAQSFNGTANITIPITAIPGTLLTGTTSISTSGNAATATLASTVTGIAGSTNASRHVWFSDGTTETSRNYDDDFKYNPSTNELTVGSITGNAATTTALANTRTFSLSGVVSTPQSFDGTTNIVIPVTSVPATLLSGTASISTTGNAGSASNVDLVSNNEVNFVRGSNADVSTVYIGYKWSDSSTSYGISNYSFYNGKGTSGALATVTASQFIGALGGNATTATTLATARTIGLSGVTATAQSFDGTANITIPITAVPATLLTGTASINTTGNAATATKAYNDANGAAITSYVKNLSISGQVVTYTKGDGTTGTITTPDNNVTNTLNTTTKAYVTGTTSSTTNTGTQIFDSDVYLGATAGTLYATTFYGTLSGNAATASAANTASRATSDSSGNNISSTYATKNQAIATIVAPTTKTYAVAGSRNTFKLNGTLADSTTYSIDTDIPAVWDANGHLCSPAGWVIYITNDAL